MPADQRGSVYKTVKGYGIRWYDEAGERQHKGRFGSKSEARTWFLDVERKRMRGETPAPSPMTLTELVDEYLAQHNTIRGSRPRPA